MKQDSVYGATKKAAEIPLEFTRTVMEKSKQLRTPSKKVSEIGTAIGCGVGGGLLLTGTVPLMMGRPLMAAGSLSAGAVTVVSNLITRRKNKKK